MEEIKKGEIRIDEISQDAKKINIKYTNLKFALWMKKMDGDDTVAYRAWKGLGANVGDWLEVQYKEEDAEWVKDGKTINFKRRTILNLQSCEGSSKREFDTLLEKGSSPAQPSADYVTKEEYDAKISAMSSAFMDMAVKIRALTDRLDKHIQQYPLIDIDKV